MTAQDAFAIAFDEEVVALDAMPSGGISKNSLPTGSSGSSGMKKNAAAAPGAKNSMGGGMQGEMSISEHMQRYHPNGFDPTKDSCSLFDKMASSLESQGMSKDEARAKALQMHNVPQSAAMPSQLPQEQQKSTPAQQEQIVQQLAQNPQAIETAPSEQLDAPEVLNTAAGEIPVQTTVQKAIVENLDQQAAQGNLDATEALNELKEGVEDGTITQSGEQTAESQEPQQTQEAPIAQEQPAEVFKSAEGDFEMIPDERQTQIIASSPEKKELFQKMVDNTGRFQSTKDPVEKEQLNNELTMLKQMFYGKDGDKKTEPQTSTVEPEETTSPKPSSTPPPSGSAPSSPTPPSPPSPPPSESGSGGGSPNPPNPPNSLDKPNKAKKDSSQRQKPRTPSDEEFRVGKNKFNVGGTTYTDVSGKGVFRSALAAFMAGLRGEGIITGWDRMNGTWDAMKRSEKGEMVRDGITSALSMDTINEYANKEGLSEDAKMEISVIQEMMNGADTPEAKMKAIKQFQKWKETYAKELGRVGSVQPTGTYEGIANRAPQWKSPPTSIFPVPSKDERDTSFMEEKRKQIEERIKDAGISAEIVESINGSSVVQFKVKRLVDGTDKALQDALKAMQTDIGTKISYTPDTTSGAERMGTITINNPKTKDASMQRLLEDKEALAAAQKMELPLMMGETAEGRTLYVDLKDHGFLGGDSGSGKSERIIGAVSGAFAVKSPSQMQVVFNAHANDADYDGFSDDPHTAGIGRNVDEVAANLANANAEWKRRQKLFAAVGARNIADYNKAMEKAGTPEKKLPSILIITDEVTDLLAQRPELAEEIDAIVRNGRKFGVAHLGITQDMGADNMPSRIKGATRMGVQSASATASKKIFDVHHPELANLNRKGDIMVKDSSGQIIRLRGTYADAATREKLLEYNTGKLEVKPTPELPKEYTDGIAQAVEKGANVSVEAIEGLEDMFKQSLPDGWTVSEEIVDGKKHWKATPPKPEKVEPKEEKKPDTAKPKNLNLKSRQDALDSIKAIKEAAIAKADADYEKDGNLDKYEKALNKAAQEEKHHLSIVNARFPENIEDGDDSLGDDNTPANEEDAHDGGNESDDEDEDTPQKLIDRARNRLKADREKINKLRDDGKISEREAMKQKAELSKRFKSAEDKFKNGGSIEDILNELEPEEKPEEQTPQETKETSTSGEEANNENEEIDAEAAAAQEEEKRNEQRRNSVPPQKGYSEKTIAGSYEATERLTPKDQKNIKERFLPDDWEFVTENGFNAPAKNKFGVIFVHDPKTGSQGRLIPDPKDPKSFRLQKDVDTTHPEFRGFVKKSDGTWELSPEAKKVEEETRLDRKSTDRKKREEALKRFNRARFGHDEAPDNILIVSNAIMDALRNVQGK